MDPRRVAEVVLAAAVRAAAEAVYIEPRGDDVYAITFERDRQAIAQLSVDAATGTAAIARLAFAAGLDLTAPTAASAVVKVRSGDRHADVVVTVRPGAEPRAELMVVERRHRARAPSPRISVGGGDVIGNYQIVEPLGEGGMGSVFRVEHVSLGRQYALKVLRSPVFERDPTAAARFLREARAAARVRHPHIADVFDFGYLGDSRPYFVMELLPGESLADRVTRAPLAPADAVAVGRQLASALAAVHAHGIVHGDVTPSNALVVASTPIHVKLIDFGLAAIAGEVGAELADDTGRELVLGTPHYISPEQLRGLPPTDRSDQYSLGCVLFELLAGHPPYDHRDLQELAVMHVDAPIPQVTSPSGPLPARLAEVVATCMQKSPQQRFRTMAALMAALDEIERTTSRQGWRKWLGP